MWKIKVSGRFLNYWGTCSPALPSPPPIPAHAPIVYLPYFMMYEITQYAYQPTEQGRPRREVLGPPIIWLRGPRKAQKYLRMCLDWLTSTVKQLDPCTIGWLVSIVKASKENVWSNHPRYLPDGGDDTFCKLYFYKLHLNFLLFYISCLGKK